jgi:hypothetical protein
MDDIDWQSLRHAYGSADDVPDRLLSLADGDDSAIGELFGNIYHQGSVYVATKTLATASTTAPFAAHTKMHQQSHFILILMPPGVPDSMPGARSPSRETARRPPESVGSSAVPRLA